MRRHRLEARLARTPEEVHAAQRLRYRVFGEELGADLPSAMLGIDEDAFDAHCDHLVVIDVVSSAVIGTYRILSSAAARRAGGFYSETEFHLARVQLLPGLVEVGRACVDPDRRDGAVLAVLWGALARHLQACGYEHVIGCASVPARDGGREAASLYRRIAREYLSPPQWRVLPRNPLPLDQPNDDLTAEMPSLLRAYLRMGAYVCGPPAFDARFRTADMLVLLPMTRLRQRFRAHLMRAA